MWVYAIIYEQYELFCMLTISTISETEIVGKRWTSKCSKEKQNKQINSTIVFVSFFLLGNGNKRCYIHMESHHLLLPNIYHHSFEKTTTDHKLTHTYKCIELLLNSSTICLRVLACAKNVSRSHMLCVYRKTNCNKVHPCYFLQVQKPSNCVLSSSSSSFVQVNTVRFIYHIFWNTQHFLMLRGEANGVL